MKTYRQDDAYIEAFEAFLSCTDEKEVLAREVEKRAAERKASSILDIGAGNVDLAVPLSRLVRHYTAIELNPKYAETLRRAGLQVVEQEFPCEVEEQYDIVLASHSIPWDSERYQAFIEAAWGQVTARGIFIGITYDDVTSEWTKLLTACGFESKRNDAANSGRLKSMLEWVKKFGEVQVEKVTTFTASEDLDKVITALAFVYSDGVPENTSEFQANKQVPRFLEENYKVQGIYKFPWHHLIIQISKS